MAKILNSINVSGSIAKVIELPDEYIINGQVYDKNTFGPKPLDFAPVVVSANNECMFFNNLLINTSYYVHNRNMNNVIIDSNDPSISYVVPNSPYHGYTAPTSIYRFRRTATGLEVSTVSAGDYHPVPQFIGQNSERLFFFTQRYYETSYDRQSYMFAVNKTTFATELVTNIGGRVRTTILKDTPGFIYFANAGESNAFSIIKYNKTTGAITTLLSDGKTGWHVLGHVTEMTISGNIGTFYAIRDGYYKDTTSGNHYLCYRKYTLALDTEVCTASDVTLDTSILGPIPFGQITTNTYNSAFETFTFTDNGKKYATLFMYDYNFTNSIEPDRHSLHTFEMVSEDNWKLVSFRKFKPITYKGVMPMAGNKTLILTNGDGAAFYNWNTSTQNFERTAYYAMPVREIGVDMNNNIWIKKADKSMELLTNTLPIDIYADFLKDEYQYDGADVDTSVEVFARNYQGQYLTSSIELTLVGPAKFTDSGLKKKTVTTSNLNKIQIPVTVTGAGLLSVNVKLL